MAQIGRAGLLQLLRGTREPRELGRVPGPIAGAVVANSSSPEPATPPTVDPDACAGSTMATSTARAPSLSRSSLRRQSSEIRTGCANERPSGSGEGVARNHDPYSDLTKQHCAGVVEVLSATPSIFMSMGGPKAHA